MKAQPGGPSRARALVAPRCWLTNKMQSNKMVKKKMPNKTRTKSSHKSSGGEGSFALDITLSPAGAELLRVAHMAPDPEALASVRMAKVAPIMGVASVCAACLSSFPTDAELKREVDSAAARAVATAIAKYGNQ